MLKVMTIVGTRPEIIRLSRTMALLDEHVNQVIVHTGQNYDYELNEIFWEDLELRRPDHFLNIDRSSLGGAVGDIIKESEKVMLLEKPDVLLILGDTNSCLSAYMAKRLRIPIFHMEAGNRSFDFNVPEEINRRIIDHLADYNLVYTEHARRHLISEGLSHRRIYLTGSPMYEILNYYMPKINDSTIVSELGLVESKYILVSVHREENVDNEVCLLKILQTLNQLCELYSLPVIVSTHPRTRKNIKKLNSVSLNKLINLANPFGYFDFVKLQQCAFCTISDSGTISEESAILSFPAVSLRRSMERPEAQDTGTIILTGFDPQTIIDSINISVQEMNIKVKYGQIPVEYQVENTSWRTLKLIIGNSKLSNMWWGIEKPSSSD